MHTGSIDGMVAIHGLIRDERVGVYVLANRDHTEVRHALMLSIFDRFIGGGERDWSAVLLKGSAATEAQADERRKRLEAARVTGTSPALPLARYAGTYSDPLRGDITVTLEDGRLHARYGTAYVGALEHWHYETFRATWKAQWRGTTLLTFGLDESGQPARLEGFGARFIRRRGPAE